MFKNVKVKRIIKRTVFPAISLLNKIIPKRDDYILLYSANGGIRHNLRPLYDYLLEHSYDSKYRIICGIESLKYKEQEKRVVFVDRYHSIFFFLRATHVYYTTGQLPIKPSKRQTVIHLDHGATNFKACGKLSKINNGEEFYFTYYAAPSEVYRKIVVAEYGCRESNVLINGEPVLDVFFEQTKSYGLGGYKRIGIWVPTFRQSDSAGYNDSSESLVPLFTPEEYADLNEKLKFFDMKLIIKLHSGQNLNDYDAQTFSHLELLSDNDFVRKGYQLYLLLKQMDFLIADYSSVFLQFLLLDKPIGFVVPDIEEYTQRRGFVFENPLEYMPGDIIKTKEQLYHFLEDISLGKDGYMEERHRVCDKVHTYRDGKNTRRVLEFSGITQ
ncbi:MAG TPA: hypothetical protein DDY31_12340 [Lachnospiraceae bacterium]|nr:hypothetical protein [Lachnospiraceae bacterium]